jgi:hypothetical protein
LTLSFIRSVCETTVSSLPCGRDGFTRTAANGRLGAGIGDRISVYGYFGTLDSPSGEETARQVWFLLGESYVPQTVAWSYTCHFWSGFLRWVRRQLDRACVGLTDGALPWPAHRGHPPC